MAYKGRNWCHDERKERKLRWFGQTSVGVIAYLASVGFFRSDTFETNLP